MMLMWYKYSSRGGGGNWPSTEVGQIEAVVILTVIFYWGEKHTMTKDNLAIVLIKDVEFSKYPKALESLNDEELKEEFKYRLDLRWELSGLAGAKQSKFAFAAMDEMKKRGI